MAGKWAAHFVVELLHRVSIVYRMGLAAPCLLSRAGLLLGTGYELDQPQRLAMAMNRRRDRISIALAQRMGIREDAILSLAGFSRMARRFAKKKEFLVGLVALQGQSGVLAPSYNHCVLLPRGALRGPKINPKAINSMVVGVNPVP